MLGEGEKSSFFFPSLNEVKVRKDTTLVFELKGSLLLPCNLTLSVFVENETNSTNIHTMNVHSTEEGKGEGKTSLTCLPHYEQGRRWISFLSYLSLENGEHKRKKNTEPHNITGFEGFLCINPSNHSLNLTLFLSLFLPLFILTSVVVFLVSCYLYHRRVEKKLHYSHSDSSKLSTFEDVDPHSSSWNSLSVNSTESDEEKNLLAKQSQSSEKGYGTTEEEDIRQQSSSSLFHYSSSIDIPTTLDVIETQLSLPLPSFE
jgi:hypothetical protein